MFETNRAEFKVLVRDKFVRAIAFRRPGAGGCRCRPGSVRRGEGIEIDFLDRRVRIIGLVNAAFNHIFQFPHIARPGVFQQGLGGFLAETGKIFQAQFLIPTVVSLAFGVLFASTVTLLLVPILYLMLDDFQAWAGKILNRDKAMSVQGTDVTV